MAVGKDAKPLAVKAWQFRKYKEAVRQVQLPFWQTVKGTAVPMRRARFQQRGELVCPVKRRRLFRDLKREAVA